MKKHSVFTAALFATTIFAFNTFAADYGAVLSSNSDIKFDGGEYKQANFEQSESLTPYFKAAFNETSYFAAEASVKHNLSTAFGSKSEAQNSIVLDLNLLKVSKIFKLEDAQNIELSAGRMFVSDSTGIIFAQPSDGVMLKYVTPSLNVGFYCGYTGLQNIKSVDILSADGKLLTPTEDRILYDFAAPYIAGALSVAAPYCVGGQSLSAELTAFIPTGGPNKLPDGEKNRFYLTLTANGPILPEFFYSFSGTMETNDFKGMAFLTNLNLTYYLEEKNANLGINAVWASGDKEGFIDNFVGFTSQASCRSAERPGYSGTLKAGFNAGLKPLQQVAVSADVDVVFNTQSKVEYYGMQAALAAQWQVFSDLQISLGAGAFFGKDKSNSRTEFVLSGALAF